MMNKMMKNKMGQNNRKMRMMTMILKTTLKITEKKMMMMMMMTRKIPVEMEVKRRTKNQERTMNQMKVIKQMNKTKMIKDKMTEIQWTPIRLRTKKMNPAKGRETTTMQVLVPIHLMYLRTKIAIFDQDGMSQMHRLCSHPPLRALWPSHLWPQLTSMMMRVMIKASFVSNQMILSSVSPSHVQDTVLIMSTWETDYVAFAKYVNRTTFMCRLCGHYQCMPCQISRLNSRCSCGTSYMTTFDETLKPEYEHELSSIINPNTKTNAFEGRTTQEPSRPIDDR